MNVGRRLPPRVARPGTGQYLLAGRELSSRLESQGHLAPRPYRLLAVSCGLIRLFADPRE